MINAARRAADMLSVIALFAASLCGVGRPARGQCPDPTAHRARLIPAFFDQGRVLAAPVSANGDTSYFVLDSGGSINALAVSALARLGLQLASSTPDSTVRFPSSIDSLQLPRPRVGSPPGYLYVSGQIDAFGRMFPMPITGFLGGGWWADRVWRIDYPARKLWIFPRSVLPANRSTLGPHEARLHFRVEDGKRSTNFARLRAEIDGDSLDLLFDTGAATQLTDSAAAVVNDGRPAKRAGSFISAEIFDRWHQRHPEWRVIKGGETRTHAALIEVPSMKLGGYTIGPVWWEERSNAEYHRWIAWMDKPIQGSIGGDAFRHFAITLDYVSSVVCFDAPAAN